MLHILGGKMGITLFLSLLIESQVQLSGCGQLIMLVDAQEYYKDNVAICIICLEERKYRMV